MRNEERIEGLSELKARVETIEAEMLDGHREMEDIVASDKCDPPERADQLISRQKELHDERNAVVARLAELHPALSAGSN